MPKRVDRGPVVVTQVVGPSTTESFLDDPPWEAQSPDQPRDSESSGQGDSGFTDDPPWLVFGSEANAVVDRASDPGAPVRAAEEAARERTVAEELIVPEPAKKPARKRATGKKAASPEGESPEVVSEPAPMVLESLDDSADRISALFYGAEGSGKTTDLALMTALPGKGKVLIVNAEGGLKRRALAARGVDTSRIMTYPPKGERVTFDGLEQLFFQIAADLDRDPDSWLGTGWDSATDIHQELLDQVVEQEMAVQAEILARNKGNRPGNIKLRDRFDNDRDDYRRMSNQFRQLLRKYRYLPCHFGVTALLRRDEDERTKRVTYGPAVTPGIQTDLLGYVDMVLYCQVAEVAGEPIWFAQTTPTRDARAKDRHAVLPTEMVNPSFDRLFSYMVGDLTADVDPDQKMLAVSTDRGAAVRVKADVAGDPKPARPRPSGKRATPAAAPVVTGNAQDEPNI